MVKTTAPLVLLRGPERELETERAVLAEAGWTIREGWLLPEEAWDLHRLVCLGVVRDRADARAAVLAAARGAGLVVGLDAPEDVVAALYEDLSHLGAVELRGPHGADGLGSLDGQQRRLLALLAEGRSLAEMADELSYSRRTVSRHLAALRRQLGVSSNAEVVSEYGRRQGAVEARAQRPGSP